MITKKKTVANADKFLKPANYLIRKKTNLKNTGLISANRSTKATLKLTIPGSVFKSSAKDLSYPIFEIVIHGQVKRPFRLKTKTQYMI